MRLEIDTTVSAPLLAGDAEVRAKADAAEAKSELNQGIKAAQVGNRAQARAALSRATQLDPRNESAWLWLASISEYPEELLGFLNHVLEINPENERAIEWKTATHTLLSKTFVQRGIDATDEHKNEFAAECFQTAIEYDEQNAAAWMWLASLSDSNTVKITLLEKVVSIEPLNRAAITALEGARQSIATDRLSEAKAAVVAGNNRVAIGVLDDLLYIDPDSIDAWTLKSHLAENFKEKIRCFENILRIDPTNVAARASRDSLLAIFESVPAPAVKRSQPEENVAIEQPYELAEPVPAAVVEPQPFVFDAAPEYRPAPELEIVPSWTEPSVSDEADRESESVDETYYEREEPEYIAEPFASLAEETTDSVDAYGSGSEGLIAADHTVYSGSSSEDREKVQPDHADPRSKTVAFEYDASSHFSLPGYAEESAEHDTDEPLELDLWSTSPSNEPPIARPGEALPHVDAPSGGTGSSYATFVETSESHTTADTSAKKTSEVLSSKADSIQCPFCGHANEAQAISCHSCTAVLTLSDLELLLANQDSNKPALRQAVEEMERKRQGRELGADELVTLGLGHLNLRNLQFGYAALMEASKLTPNNVVLGGQVNSLLIRLDEIRQQEEVHLKMPKGKSILVVDDSPTVRKLIAGKLEKCGHDVVCANDGVEAIERLQNFVPHLVLLDITMPRMDGYQVCKQIRSNPSTKDVPVIMISGKDGFFDKVRGRMAGTTGYITKPFGPDTLMKTVEMYLSGEAPELDEYDRPT